MVDNVQLASLVHVDYASLDRMTNLFFPFILLLHAHFMICCISKYIYSQTIYMLSTLNYVEKAFNI